jgi:nitroimidazol reductase NimA-like FMN-containing flavoprotein (pyridoxamine 5'-phosphate oxidase superfamily)
MTRDRNGLEILSRVECLDLLARRPVGRVALSRHALPVILPVTYRLVDEDVYFSTVTGTKSTAVADQTVIAFEVDDIDPDTRTGWSVLVVGVATEIDPGHDIVDRLRAIGLRSWIGERAVHLVRLRTDRLSGRRLPTGLASPR